jgi:hypothetical protein
MANISVSELLFDPDFCDLVTIIRAVETVDEYGKVSYSMTEYEALASIQSAGGDELTMLPDLARTGGTYEITTCFPLCTATDLTKADTVIWRDSEFVVISVGRFDNFGDQYEGVMTIKTISPRQGPAL